MRGEEWSKNKQQTNKTKQQTHKKKKCNATSNGRYEKKEWGEGDIAMSSNCH